MQEEPPLYSRLAAAYVRGKLFSAATLESLLREGVSLW